VQDVYDTVDYLASLGKSQTAAVKRDAEIGVAQVNSGRQRREGERWGEGVRGKGVEMRGRRARRQSDCVKFLPRHNSYKNFLLKYMQFCAVEKLYTVKSLQSHFILTLSHWSSGLPISFPSQGTRVQNPMGVLMWNRDSPVSDVLLQYN
jgi:hypothetical protein